MSLYSYMKDNKEREIFLLTVKYWLRGDNWADAKSSASTIVLGFKSSTKKKEEKI